MFSLIVSSEITYDSAEELAESPIGAMYTKIVILKDDDWMVKTGGEWENQKRWLNTVLEHNARTTLGIIGGGHFSIFKQIGDLTKKNPDDVELFCHGLTHLIIRNDTHKINEFRGTSLESQNHSLLKSKEIAREVIDYEYKVFGAPGNAYEARTFDLLREHGFIVSFTSGGSDIGDYTDGILSLKIDWSAGFSKVDIGIEQYQKNYLGEHILVIQTHSWSFTKKDTRAFGEFIDYLNENESKVFMTGYEYYKWFLDKDKISLTEDRRKYILDLSEAQFDHEITFERMGLENIVVTDKSTNQEIPYDSQDDQIIFKTEAGQVYDIGEPAYFPIKRGYIVLAVILSSILLARYLKLFKS